ncbi:MAG: TonB-dependent receptor plug domain-containing protein [Thermoanaerobaculia bacterium]
MSELHRRFGIGLTALCLCTGPALAQDNQEAMEEIEDVIVVTASRTEQRLHEVPAAISVLSAKQMEQIPADDFGDYLRNVPGLNVSQMSARDIQITGRAATNSLATSQLVLLDNRTLYLDFFGFVMWDFVPLDAKEIKQIEVVRGPGSAVWGANAMSGVINLITKRPSEMQGTSLTVGGGDFGTLYGSVTHAGVTSSGKGGYKVSASFYEQDAYNRPTGIIPGTVGPTNPTGTPYSAVDFVNKGTEQPKFNFRFDHDPTPGTSWSVSGGYAGTDGIIHTGIGPFDIESGSLMNFLKVDWSRRAQRATFFVNLLDGDALNLLVPGVDGRPLAFSFESETYNLDYSDTRISGTKNIFSYGATVRENNFDLSIAPAGDSRQEFGVFLQDEILLGDKARWLIGARWDDIDPIGSVVSPRTSFLFSPNPNNTFRISYNRAFRAPSMINNFLDITIIQAAVVPIPLPTGVLPIQFIFPARAIGNPLVTEEQLDAIELGYVGTFGSNTFTISIYENETTDSVDFFTAANHLNANFIQTNPPLPPPLLNLLLDTALNNVFPALFSYRNIGETVDSGVEIGFNSNPRDTWSWFFNYSWQDEPEVTGVDPVTLPNGTVRQAVNSPPENRANLGLAYDTGKFFFNVNANYQDEAFWTDVLDSRFWGPTDAFTQVNLGLGFRTGGDSMTFTINAQNVFDEDVQQHVFGDLIEQKITGQLLFRF